MKPNDKKFDSTSRDIRQEIKEIYTHLLKRAPGSEEFESWCSKVEREDLQFQEVFELFTRCDEYRAMNRVRLFRPAGHYYSPVVDSESLRSWFKTDRDIPATDILGIELDDSKMLETFKSLEPFIKRHKFSATKRNGERYYHNNMMFPVGDAIILSALIGKFRPKNIIEIGSGFSTACMLDTIDRERIETQITCIEPYPDRLKSNLLDTDRPRVKIIEQGVQTVDFNVFSDLGEGDVLFIDSTHVVKTGSDVCVELFDILPRLNPGVMVHFHDIFYPFEYPEGWIYDQQYSWNEIYALKAFLMYNKAFEIFFFNSYFGRKHGELLENCYGEKGFNRGGGIWLRVQPH